MKRIASLFTLGAMLLPMSAFAYPSLVEVDSDLKISDRVIAHTIEDDVNRVQSHDEVDGKTGTVTRVLNQQAYLANMDVLIGICQTVRQLAGLSSEGCGKKSAGRTRQ